MLPDAAQGFSTIVEDVGVLSHLLSHHFGRGVPAVMDIWQKVRMPRVNKIKAWARFNSALFTQGMSGSSETGGEETMPEERPSLEQVEMDMDAGYLSPAFLKWAFWFHPVADVEAYIASTEKASL